MAPSQTKTTAMPLRPFSESLPAIPFPCLAAVLLLWGWRSELLILAVPMSMLLAVPDHCHWRVRLGHRDFCLLANVTAVVILILMLYLTEKHGANTIIRLLQLLPLLSFPLLLAQCFNTESQMRLSVFFVSLRYLDQATRTEYDHPIDIRLPYFLLSLLAATINPGEPELFGILCLLLLLLLLPYIAPRIKPPWYKKILAICAVSLLGIGLQFSARHYYPFHSQLLYELIQRFLWLPRDPLADSSTIGNIGRAKISDRIVLWVRARDMQQAEMPILLKEASYNHYKYARWTNTEETFSVVDKDIQLQGWLLRPSKQSNLRLHIGTRLYHPRSILALPLRTTTVYAKNILSLERSNLGQTRVDINPGWLEYQTHIGADGTDSAVPDVQYLSLVDRQKPLFEELATELQLRELDHAAAVERIKRYFSENFRYSLRRGHRHRTANILEQFLHHDKSGHCEYFATATTLLLRTIGIPARYTTGYALFESHPLGKAWIVRNSHAHSWVQYYLDGQWHVLDTTPAIWIRQQSRQSFFTTIYDALAWIRYLYAAEEDYGTKRQNPYRKYLPWLLIPLLGLAAWRLRRLRYQRLSPTTESGNHTASRQGADSPLYPLLANLVKRYGRNKPDEPLSHWMRRTVPVDLLPDWLACLDLHYHYRFGPDADTSLRKQLVAQANRLRLE